MTTRRNKGLVSLDLVLPVANHYRTDPQILREVEAMRTNATSRWAKDNHSDAPSRFRHPHDPSSLSAKIATLARPKVETTRANSPTFKRLLAVRAKLEKYANILSRTFSSSRQSIHETQPPIVHEKAPSLTSHSIHTLSGPTSHGPIGFSHEPTKPVKSQSTLANAPLDKITYEKTWTNNGNLKQKCSLEIWLPKANVDDEELLTSHTMSPESSSREKKSPPVANIRSRRSSIIKIATTTVTDIQTKPTDDQTAKKSDTLRPRVYHYTDYIMEPSEERPRSGKSVTTVKSDGTGSVKSVRRQQNRSQTRRQSISTNHSEEILRFTTTEVSSTGKIISTTTKSNNSHQEKKSPSRPTNPSMISELMQKYSLMKKSHQELVQTRLQIEKNQSESKLLNQKNESNPTRPPLMPESTALISPDHPSVSVKKLLLDTSTSRLLADHSLTNNKLLERRATPRKPSYPDVFSQSRVYSLNNNPSHYQHRQSSASIIPNAVLPTVVGKRSEANIRFFQRSKTLDIVLDLPNESFNSVKGSSRYSSKFESSSNNFMQQSSNSTIGPFEQSSSRFGRRSVSAVRPHQQQVMTPVVQIVHNPDTRYRHVSTTRHVPSNKILVQFNGNNHRNTDRQCLVPD